MSVSLGSISVFCNVTNLALWLRDFNKLTLLTYLLTVFKSAQNESVSMMTVFGFVRYDKIGSVVVARVKTEGKDQCYSSREHQRASCQW